MICSLSTTLLTFCVTIKQKEKKRWNKNVERSSPIYAHCLYQQHNRANDLFPAQRLPAPAKCLSTIDPQQNDLPACVFPILSVLLCLKPWVLYGLNAYPPGVPLMVWAYCLYPWFPATLRLPATTESHRLSIVLIVTSQQGVLLMVYACKYSKCCLYPWFPD